MTTRTSTINWINIKLIKCSFKSSSRPTCHSGRICTRSTSHVPFATSHLSFWKNLYTSYLSHHALAHGKWNVYGFFQNDKWDGYGRTCTDFYEIAKASFIIILYIPISISKEDLDNACEPRPRFDLSLKLSVNSLNQLLKHLHTPSAIFAVYPASPLETPKTPD